ncbi:MAG TPA: hypothetical protein VG148_12570 [Pyrinomonadaceae bacterium]|nr:hypothetical protein [Pyrinomonadaceae bacterium]
MKEYFLKRALPFALTFAVGAAVGGFFQLLGTRGAGWGGPRYYRFENRRGCGKKFHRNYFAPETKPPVVLFKPDARWPRELEALERPASVSVRVTFGADGRVQEVETPHWARYSPGSAQSAVWGAIERAARQIRFAPATLDGAPVTETEEVAIRFIAD